MDDALTRAKAYIEAGCDGIMIHSKSKTPDEVFEFMDCYNKFDARVPVIVVPSTYNQVTEEELKGRKIDIVIYANHLLRSAYPAMLKTAQSILANGRSYEAGQDLLGIKEILNLVF